MTKKLLSIMKSFIVIGLLFSLLSCMTESQASQDNLIVLKAAGYNLPRFSALFKGEVTIAGTDTEFIAMGIGDMNTNAFSGSQDMDITEIGLHPFMLAFGNDNFRDYTLLPIFALRQFRHKSIFIRKDSGIETPYDLIGKTVGTAAYSSTSLTWIRGILKDEYGIDPSDINWVISTDDSSKNLAGKASKQERVMPNGIVVTMGNEGIDESELLLSGEVDALFHAAEPAAYALGDPNVIRLFEDYKTVERDFYERTGIFPIMHVVAIRTSLLEEYPWLAKAVFDAYSESKSRTYKEMKYLGWASDMLPWYSQELSETRRFMGENFYSYGIEENRKTLEALFRYSHDQGFTDQLLTIEDLFHPLGLELTENK